jgi:tetratricopeptide (TPR) repeat protein
MVFLSAIFFSVASAAFRTIQEGMTVPELKGKDLLTGETVAWKPGEGGEGPGACLIVFWATWSPRSLQLLQDLKGMAEQYAERDFKVFAINVDSERSDPNIQQTVTSLVKKLDPPFPVILDDQLKLFYAYGVIAVPSVAAVDADGILRYGPAGYSYGVKDGLVDSTEVMLGIRVANAETILVEGHRPNPKADRYYNLGRQLAGKGLFKQALGNLKKSAAADTLFSSPHNLQGQIQLGLGDLEDAASSFAKAVEIDSTSVAARTGWGRAHLALGRIDVALTQFTVAKDLDETYTPALLGLAKCHLALGQHESAWPLLQAALELNPREPELLYSLGLYYRSLGNSADTLEAFRAAIEQLVTLPIVKH